MATSKRLTLILVVVCAINAFAQEIGFPEEEDESNKNAQNKKPVFLPTQCNENELFYPGDQKNDWVCDCKPGYIYHPKTDRCYSPYRQGPCAASQFLMIPSGQYVPECLPNSCNTDGLVTFENKCHALNKAGPCKLAELTYVVAVNENTLKLECIQENPFLISRFNDDDCLLGSKRCIEKQITFD